jgi:acyl-CoA dehydrogenase
MTGTETLVAETAERLFADLCPKETVDAAERGVWPERLWAEIEGAGFAAALVVARADEMPEIGVAAAILRSAGRVAAPVPIAETLLAGWVLSASGLAVPAGPLTLAPVGPADELRLTVEGDAAGLQGAATRVPWAARAARIAVVARTGEGWSVARVDPAGCEVRPGRSHAGEPRDDVVLDGVTVPLADVAPLATTLSPERIHKLGALMRTVMMAGALDRVLALSVQYAGERVQFGRPLAGFQAIRHQLAILAGEVAAAGMAAEAAVAAASRGELDFAVAAAKIRVGEAAGRAAAIAHQVHGAIGFTHEHSLHHSTRRLWSWRDEFGSESEWALALGTEIAEGGAEGLWPRLTGS